MQSLPNFPGPMAIDGYAHRQGTAGDWLPGPGGATNVVFTPDCTPLVPLAFHLTDLWNDQINDDIFDGGNKLFQDPNTWGWRSQKPPAKDDINNSMIFIALNPVDNHIWIAISGDRMSTNGTSYLDFEFYQNSITKTGGPIPGGTGGFVSTGPHGGRTVGDLSITLEYTQGGSFATVSYLQWQPGSEAGSYDYVPIIPPAGTSFAAGNGTTIDYSCGAFGGTTYQPLQFAEAAIDISALIGGLGLPGECGSLPFETLFIKTKSSAERTADLKDFISPFQINICFDHTAPTINCPNQLNLGCNPTIPPPSGATASDNCNGVIIPVAADGPVSSNGCQRSMTRIWRATDACGNSATCGQLITWTSSSGGPVFTGSYANVDLGCNPANPGGSLGSASASDACAAVTITSSDGAVVSNGCGRSQTRTFTANDACGSSSTISRTVTWIVDQAPPAFTGGYNDVSLGCNPANPDASLGTASATDACGSVTISASDGAVVSDGCSRSRTRTFTARDGCNNTASVSRTVRWTADAAGPTFTGSYADVNLGCNPANPDGSLGSASATDACGAVTITSSDGSVVSDGCNRSRTRTFTATDGCGNTATVSRTVRWIVDVTSPVFTGSYADVNLGCNPANPGGSLGSASATDGCGAVTITSSDGSVQSSGCNRSQTRTFTARDGCGNTATTSRTVRWISDVTAPTFVTTPASVDIECFEAIPTSAAPTATDACSTPTVTSTGSTDNEFACTAQNNFKRIITRSWRAVDGCGNTATYTQTIRVKCCEAICTYTQGAYGNAGGQDCDGTTSMSTTALINQSIANWGGLITIGKPGSSVTIATGQASCVIAALPGGGPSKELPASNSSICNLPNSLLNGQGRIRNVLLAQTITLALNIGITSPSDLGIFPLQGGVLVTADPLGGCGSDIPDLSSCTQRTISAAVVNAIPGTKNVAGLLELANRALANTDGVVGSENGVSLSAINDAVSAINEVFDECKIFIGWNVPCPSGGRVVTSNSTSSEPSLIVTAFPNPYQENFTLRINSPVTGQASISFYTIDGVKISEMKKDVVALREVSVPYNVPGAYKTRIVYTVTISGYNAKGVVLSPNEP